MHVSAEYLKGMPGMGASPGPIQPPAAPAPDVAALIRSWAPLTLRAGEVRTLLGEAVKAAAALKPRIPADIYGQVAKALKTLADIAGQMAGKAEASKSVPVSQTQVVIEAVIQFWRVAHAAGVASKTTLNLSPTQALLQAAAKRSKTYAVTVRPDAMAVVAPPPVEKSGGMPTWGWVAIGVTVLAAVGTVIAVIYANKKGNELPEGAEPLKGISDGDEDEEAA